MANKVTSNYFEKVIKENIADDIVTINWNGMSVDVTPFLDENTMEAVINLMLIYAFANEDGGYTPELIDFAKRVAIIEAYTNITLPKDMSKRYELLTRATSLINDIVSVVDHDQYGAMMEAAAEKIDLAKASLTSEITKAIGDITNSFDRLEGLFSDMFGNVTSDDLNKLISAIGNNGVIDERKIMDAYLDKKSEQKVIPFTSENDG